MTQILKLRNSLLRKFHEVVKNVESDQFFKRVLHFEEKNERIEKKNGNVWNPDFDDDVKCFAGTGAKP